MTSHLSNTELDAPKEEVVSQTDVTSNTTAVQGRPSTFTTLPPELLEHIVGFLNPRHKTELWKVDRRIHDIVQRSFQEDIKVLIDEKGVRSTFPLDKLDEELPIGKLNIEVKKTPAYSDHSRCTHCSELRIRSLCSIRPRPCIVAVRERLKLTDIRSSKELATEIFAKRPISSFRTCRVDHVSQYSAEEYPFNVSDIIGDIPCEFLVEVTSDRKTGSVDRFQIRYTESGQGEPKFYAGDAVTVGDLLMEHKECTWVKDWNGEWSTCAADIESADLSQLRAYIGSKIREGDAEEKVRKSSTLIKSYLSSNSRENFEQTGARRSLLAFDKDLRDAQMERDEERQRMWERMDTAREGETDMDEKDPERERFYYHTWDPIAESLASFASEILSLAA